MLLQSNQHLYEYHHSLRVARLCETWYKIGWMARGLALLVKAAELHDIGKFRIDPALLELPRKLTPEEMSVVKRHPLHSYDWVYRHLGCRNIARIVAQHHESSDGSGYPAGITNIRPEAIIIKVCDVYDALTNDRPYRPAHSKEEALAIMERELRGTRESEVLKEFAKVLASSRNTSNTISQKFH